MLNHHTSERDQTGRSALALLSLAILYGVASLTHFVHNALYLHDYPKMPTWITSLGVYAAWLVVATVGCVGYGLYRWGARKIGLLVLAIYALMGLDSLAHYVLAPLAAHSMAMNATILGEVGSAAVLLVFVAYLLFAEIRAPYIRS
jgi:hypothetical protein